jgi:hypothetical protein
MVNFDRLFAIDETLAPSCWAYLRPQDCQPAISSSPSSSRSSPEFTTINIDPYKGRQSEKKATYPHADEISKLGVGVNIHLDNTVVDGGVDFLLSRAGSTMEDKVPEEERRVREVK